MAKRNYLEDLVNSLTQGELKKLSFYTKNITSKKNYLEILDDIRKNKTSKRQKYDNKYAQQRRYLYNIILESMVQKVQDDTIEGKIFFYIKSVNYLLSKQLLEQAYDIINKALNIVRKYEMFGYHLAILELEKEARLFTNDSKHRTDNDITEEEKKLITFQKELQTIKLIYSHILTHKKKYGFMDPQQWLKLKNDTIQMGLKSSADSYQTNKAKFYYYYSQAILHLLGHRNTDAFNFGRKILEVPKTSLSKFEILQASLDYSSLALEAGYIQEVLKATSGVTKAYKRGEFGSFDKTGLQIFYYCANHDILSYVFEGQKEKLLQKLAEAEIEYKKWENKIPLGMKIIITTGFIIGYFAVGELKKSIKRIQFILQNQRAGLRLDAYEGILIYHLLTIFDKNDISFLENESRKVYYYFKYRYLESKNKEVKTKKNIAHLLLQFAMYRISKKEMLTEMIRIILDWFKENNGYAEIEYPYLIWANSKLQNKTFIEMAAEMSKVYLKKLN